jgi:hypothetical protein
MAYLQFGAPVVLILWFALAPLRGRARLAHAALTATCLLIAGLLFRWSWPSAYAPVLFLGVFLLAFVIGRRRPANPRQPVLWPGFLAGLLALAGGVGVAVLVNARLLPPAGVLLASPFAAPALVTEGGALRLINRHRDVLDPDSPSLGSWRGTAHGISLLPVDRLGRPLPAPQPVQAPCAGGVIAATSDPRLGPLVLIDCGGDWVTVSGLATTAPGIAVGQKVSQGQALGEGGPITLHAQRPASAAHPFSGTPLWLQIAGVKPVRGWILSGGPQPAPAE